MPAYGSGRAGGARGYRARRGGGARRAVRAPAPAGRGREHPGVRWRPTIL